MEGVANSFSYEEPGPQSPPAWDRRSGERQKTILRVAKLVSGPNRGLAIIRNISDSGMMIEVNPTMKVDDDVTIMLSDDHAIEGEMRWRQSSQIGIRFKEPASVEEILARPRRASNGHVTRLPRFEVAYPVTLVSGGTVVEGAVADISLGGIRVQARTTLKQGDDVTVLIPDLRNLQGTVRWCSEQNVGISFLRPVHIQDLMAWLAACEEAAGYSSPLTGEDSGESASPCEPPFAVTAFDESGTRLDIATANSAAEAWQHFNASRSLFYRVTVVDRAGVETFPVRLKALASREIPVRSARG